MQYNSLRNVFQMTFRRYTANASMSSDLSFRKISIFWSISKDGLFKLPTSRNFRQSSSRCFSTTASARNDKQEKDPEESGKSRYLKLMDFNELIWPNPFKSIKNFFMSVLIRGYFDSEFTVAGFLTGAEQAMVHVSGLVGRGKFDGLEDLVTREAVQEIEKNYDQLEVRHREIIPIDPTDLFLRYIYEIGIIFDDSTNKRFVEITTVMQGIQGMGLHVQRGGNPSDMKKNPDQLYICNYRFVREYKKGVQSDWTINKLNHFLPSELVKRKGMFSR